MNARYIRVQSQTVYAVVDTDTDEVLLETTDHGEALAFVGNARAKQAREESIRS